jgi:uracil-DNA glycosylase
MAEPFDALAARLRGCRLCADRFAATATGHAPRPVLRARPGAPILIAGQAPAPGSMRSGLPFDDPSGDRLRDWLGVDRDIFYDTARIAIRADGLLLSRLRRARRRSAAAADLRRHLAGGAAGRAAGGRA